VALAIHPSSSSLLIFMSLLISFHVLEIYENEITSYVNFLLCYCLFSNELFGDFVVWYAVKLFLVIVSSIPLCEYITIY
jgi:hypothetical protein